MSDLDLTLQTKKSSVITAISTADEKAMSAIWNGSNRFSIMFMRMTIASNIKTTLPTTDNAMKFLNNLEEYFCIANKSFVGTLMANLTTMNFDGTRGMYEYILEMINLAAKLKVLGMNVNDFFLVQFILNSLPSQYWPFQIHYNTIKDKWNVNELDNVLVKKEAILKKQEHHSILLVSQETRKK